MCAKEKEETPAAYDFKPLKSLVAKARRIEGGIRETEALEAQRTKEVAELKESADPQDQQSLEILRALQLQIELCPGVIRRHTKDLEELQTRVEAKLEEAGHAFRALVGGKHDSMVDEIIRLLLPYTRHEAEAREIAGRCSAVLKISRDRERWEYAGTPVERAEALLKILDEHSGNRN